MPPTSVHFNGSVNLPDGETVMREISARIPNGVRRMTDGETGDRNYWIHFQIRKFRQMPEFETVSGEPAPVADADAPPMYQLKLADGASADTIQWPDLGYAAEYAESFALFDRLQQEGTIAAGVRFQAQYPTPIASMVSVAPEDMPAVVAGYEQALFADVDKLLAAVPHDRVAVQWDVAVEFSLLEGAYGVRRCRWTQLAPGLVRCIEHVPADVPVGLHLCYGDYGHEHFKQPESLRMQVDLVNALTAAASRPFNWVSFTVPQGRGDADYFAPLAGLRAAPETELDFALVPYHPGDQAEGHERRRRSGTSTPRWAAASGACAPSAGWAACAPEDVPQLLDIHAALLA